jgi:hypothetical protein
VIWLNSDRVCLASRSGNFPALLVSFLTNPEVNNLEAIGVNPCPFRSTQLMAVLLVKVLMAVLIVKVTEY